MSDLLNIRTAADALVAEFLPAEIDMFSVPELRGAFRPHLEKHPDVIVVDLGHTTYMDSSALGYLFSLYKDVNGYGGRLALARVQKRIVQLLTINGANKYFEMYDTVEQAIDGV